MSQLPLFTAEAEAERTLREELNILGADYARVEALLEKARVEYRKLQAKHDQCARERDNWRNSCVSLAEDYRERGMELYRLRLALARQAPAPAPTLEPILKKLLSIAHPDRWSQEQPATQLAHELSIVINDLRAEVQA